MKVLYIVNAGASDPSRASVPWHIAINGSLAEGQEVALVLAGDATDLLVGDAIDRTQAPGIPAHAELVAAARDQGVEVGVCKGCALARGVVEDDLSKVGGRWVTPPDVARLIAEADRTVCF